MRVTISTEYDEDAGDFTAPVTIEVSAPPMSGEALLHAYEVEDTPDGIALNAWAREQFSPYAKVESVVVEAADEPMLVGCEFVTRDDTVRLTGHVTPPSHASRLRRHMDCTPDHCLWGDPSPCALFTAKPVATKPVEERILDVLMEHYPTQGVMASPNHWAYHKGWFAHCGTGWEDQRGCGWSSEPDTYPDRMAARRAALTHLAQELVEAIRTSAPGPTPTDFPPDTEGA